MKHGQAWLIPADAKKPADPRTSCVERGEPFYIGKEKSLSSDLENIIKTLTTAPPLPWEDPDSAVETIPIQLRLYCEGWLAYLRGDFARTKQCFREVDNEAMKLWACSLAVAAAIDMGDYPFYNEVESYCKSVIESDTDTNLTAVARWALMTAYVGAFVPNMVPGWLKDGEFSSLPIPLRHEAIFMRTRYLFFQKDYKSVLEIARTALTFIEQQEDGVSPPGIYLPIMYAVACSALGRLDEAEKYLLGIMSKCLPLGFITPFIESLPLFGGLLEKLIERDYPWYYSSVTEQSERAVKNWLDFHNHFTKDNITTILSLRDYQIALMAAQGMPLNEIADRFHIAIGTLNNRLKIRRLHIYGLG